jgi:putative transposase
VKRRIDKWYAVFVFDLSPKREPPAEVVAFDVNENWVAVARLSFLATVDAVARWNMQYIDPAVYSIRTDFGRLAKRYEAVRNANLEELKQKYLYAGRDEEEKCRMLQTRGSLENSRGGLERGGGRRAG